MAYRKKDIGGDVDPAAPWRDVPLHRPVTYRVTQYPAGTHIAGHKHQRHQLVSVSYTHLTLPTICSV